MKSSDIEVDGEYAAKVSYSGGRATEFQMNFGHVKVVEKDINEDHPTRAFTKIKGIRVELVEDWSLGSLQSKKKGDRLVIPSRDFHGPWAEYVRDRLAHTIRGERRREIQTAKKWRDDEARRLFDDYVAELDLSDDARRIIQRGGTTTNPSARTLAQFALAAAEGGVEWARSLNDALAEADAEFDRKVDAAKAKAIDALTDAGFDVEARDQAGVVVG